MMRHLVHLARNTLRDVNVSNKRSDKWPDTKNMFLTKNPTCAMCGSSKNLNVHHIKPFHLYPELELDPTNLVTLCMDNDCHLLIGHGDNFKAYNPNLPQDLVEIKQLDSASIKNSLKEFADKAKKNRVFK